MKIINLNDGKYSKESLELVNEYINMLNSVNFLYKKMILIKDKNSNEYKSLEKIRRNYRVKMSKCLNILMNNDDYSKLYKPLLDNKETIEIVESFNKMKLNEDWFEIDVPVVVDNELTVDEIEDNTIATPKENGVANVLTNSISDTWQKISDYNNIIATVASTNIDNSEEIISIVQDIVEDENKNVGRLMTALNSISPATDNVEVGEEEAAVKLTEDFENSKADILADVLGRSISSSDENHIYDGWRAFYDDPESFRDTIVVKLVNQSLDGKSSLDNVDDEKPRKDEVDDAVAAALKDNGFDATEEDIEENIKMEERKPHRIGTEEYDANEGRLNRIAKYRKYANLDENFQITEDNINDWALNRTACFSNRSKDQVRSEILGKKWSDFEEY